MIIRKAEIKDFDVLYQLGLETQEFKLNDHDPFMQPDEFRFAIENPYSLMLLAEEKKEILGFVYSNWDYPKNPQSAYLFYIVVRPEHKRKGIAQKLYDETTKELRKIGVEKLFVWVNAESKNGIIDFMKKNKFKEGHKFVWMEKEI